MEIKRRFFNLERIEKKPQIKPKTTTDPKN